jgi:uncharacterized protein YjbI with pentapeptide repeats
MEPDANSSERKVIQASEILAKIERGEPVEYDGVIVEGDLDISGLELPTEHVDRTEEEALHRLSEELKTIRSKMIITNSDIRNNVDFSNAHFQNSVKFEKAKFTGKHADFRGTEFGGDVSFREAEFAGWSAIFYKAKFTGENAFFNGAKFTGGHAVFYKAKFTGKNAYFVKTKFTGGNVNFKGAEFTCGDVFFNGAEFTGGDVSFSVAEFTGGDVSFSSAKFTGGDVFFSGAEFTGGGTYFDNLQFHRGVSFKETKFSDPKSQEIACRIAKRKMEEVGNKEEADDYFYREMEAVRIQNGIKGIKRDVYQNPSNIKEWLSLFRSKIIRMRSKIKRFLIYDFLEYIFIQRIFGYGVHPFNIAKTWLIVVFTLGVVYWIGSGVEKANNTLDWYEYFYFSIVTAATPGYAGYTPASGLYTLIAGAEAIFGTFMWAAFIATFARKWQR